MFEAGVSLNLFCRAGRFLCLPVTSKEPILIVGWKRTLTPIYTIVVSFLFSIIPCLCFGLLGFHKISVHAGWLQDRNRSHRAK